MGKKKAVFLTAMADEDQKTASGANASFDLMADYLGWEIVGRLNVGGCSTADDLHEEDLTAAYELGVEVKIIDRRDEDDRIGLGKVRLSSFMSSASNVHSLVRTHLSQPMQGCTSLNAASKRKTSCPALSAPRWN